VKKEERGKEKEGKKLNSGGAKHQGAPSQMTWLEDTPPWLRRAYCCALLR